MFVERDSVSVDELARKAARYAVLVAVIEELKESSGAVPRDRKGALVSMILRTGLDRGEIEAAAAELLPLMRFLADELRGMGL